MKYTSYKSKSKHTKKVFFIVCLISFIILMPIIYILEINHIIDLYKKPIINEGFNNRLENINYSPSGANEKPSSEDKAKDTNINNINDTHSIIINANGQDVDNGPLVIRTTIIGYTSKAKCYLLLKMDDIRKDFSSDIEWTGNYYSCSGFSINSSELSKGKWNATLTVSEDDYSKNLTFDTEVGVK